MSSESMGRPLPHTALELSSSVTTVLPSFSSASKVE